MKKHTVLFVCLGNICRSPVAEAVFRQLVTERGLTECFHIESCGTGAWHVGESAHPESARVAKKNGVSLTGHRARQIAASDFTKFDLIVAMDRSNLRDVKRFGNDSRAQMICLRQYDPEDTDPDVPDPYAGGADGFQLVHDIISRCCVELLNALEQKIEP